MWFADLTATAAHRLVVINPRDETALSDDVLVAGTYKYFRTTF